jgi:hypothetical protein
MACSNNNGGESKVENLKLTGAACLLAVALAVGPVTSAEASLIGDTVQAEQLDPVALAVFVSTGQKTASAMVSTGGPEFQLEFNNAVIFEFDIDAESIKISAPNTITFVLDDIEFSDLDWVGQLGKITDVSIQSSSNVNGFSLSNISFTDDSVRVDLFDTDWFTSNGEASVTLSLQTTHADLPEPATLAMLSLGLLGASYAKRRRAH